MAKKLPYCFCGFRGYHEHAKPIVTRSQRDEAKRTSTLTRIEKYILEAIRQFAAAKTPPSTIKSEMERVLRTAFKVKP